MAEKMSLRQVILDALAESGITASVGEVHSVADTITRHLTQPAHAVDVGAVNGVISDLEERARNGGDAFPDEFESWAETLTRAIGNAQAEGWKVPDAVRKGFMTSESCGPDKHYVLKIRFQSLADLQAAHHAMLGLSPTPPQPEE